MFLAKIIVKFKKNVKNPEVQTLKTLVARLDFSQIKDISSAKFYEIKIDADSKEQAQQIATEIADKVLSNPIIEEFEVEISDES